MESIDWVTIVVLGIGILPLILFVYFYGTRPAPGKWYRRKFSKVWMSTPVGAVIMSQKLAMITLLTFILIVRASGGDFPARPWIALGLYTILVGLFWAVLIVLRRIQKATETRERPKEKAMNHTTAAHINERTVLADGSTLDRANPTTGVPTQIANPSRASWRTFVQSLLAFLVVLNAAALIVLPFVLDPANGLKEALGPVYGWVVLGLNAIVFIGSTISKLVALLMANPTVNAWVTKHLPWLAPIKPLA